MMMNVQRLGSLGGPEVFEGALEIVPTPGSGEFLVRVRACGVCGHDVLARSGKLSASIGDVIGHEISGVVEEVGSPDLGDWLGARVALVQRRSCGACAECESGWSQLCRNGPGFYGDDVPGGYSEYVLAGPGNAVRVPNSIDDATAAILSCGVGTGLHALRSADVGEADVVLISGASGGVGSHAVQLARHLGARVIATTSSSRHRNAVSEAGADIVLVRPDVASIREAAAALGRPRGVDVALEVTGLPMFSTSLRSLGARGRLVVIGNVTPSMLPLDPGLTIVKELRLLGSAHANREDLHEVVDLVAAGKIVPCVSQTFPLEHADAAHAAHDKHEHTGRVVLVP